MKDELPQQMLDYTESMRKKYWNMVSTWPRLHFVNSFLTR